MSVSGGRRAAILALGLLAPVATAQDTARNQPERRLNEEQQALARAWEEASSPGVAHDQLAVSSGQWSMTIRSWLDPALPPETSTGTAYRYMLLDGRVLEERVISEAAGGAYEGIGRTGYDGATGRYWRTWIDNQGTGCFVSTGARDEAAGATTFTGDLIDPMSRYPILVRAVLRDEGADRQVLEWFENRGQGELKTMEIVYERQ